MANKLKMVFILAIVVGCIVVYTVMSKTYDNKITNSAVTEFVA